MEALFSAAVKDVQNTAKYVSHKLEIRFRKTLKRSISNAYLVIRVNYLKSESSSYTGIQEKVKENILQAIEESDETYISKNAEIKIKKHLAIEGVGSLNGGFKLRVADEFGVPDRVHYGQMVKVSTEWTLKSLGDVRFNYQSCEVSQGENSKTFIIKDWCYADLFNARPIAASQAGEIRMEYRAFVFEDLEDFHQQIMCSIEVCIDACPTKSDRIVCPNEEFDQFHQYKFKMLN